MPRPLARTLRAILYIFATLVILWLALIKLPMWLTRLHAQHLLADFQSIQVNQSDWSDAQRLMHRWGRWGHYDGTCTPAACSYSIVIEDAPTKWLRYPIEHEWVDPTMGKSAPIFATLKHLGVRYTIFDITFTVRGGKIVRTTSGIALDVPPYFRRSPNDYGYVMVLRSQVRSHLRGQRMDENQPWIPGTDEQLDNHPDYKTGHGNCEGCVMFELAYTPTLAHAEVVHLTSLNFSCITRLFACREFDQLLPAVKDWNN